ncbi:hypothetical protein BH11MYX3_BH11MYX3_04870 [soil metagenome]
MDRDRSRVLALFVVYLALIVAALFLAEWFVASTPFGKMSIDLRSATVCGGDGACDTFSLSDMRGTGFYAPLGGISFWGTLVFSLLVAYQAITRIASGTANESLTKLGYVSALALFATTGAAAFLFGPASPSRNIELMSTLQVTRGSGPFLLMLGLLVGIAVLFYAVTYRLADDVAAYKPISGVIPPKPTPTSMPVVPPISERAVHKSEPIPKITNDKIISGPTPTIPDHMRKKLNYATLTAELTRAGIDARREDGSSRLVMWRDVVGLVARRLPADYDGMTFIDVVSNACATIRLLPWTRLTGEPIEGFGETWGRALLAAMIAKCPEASLDPATRRFVAGEPAAQLPDLAKLAAHDEKLS